MHRRPKLAVEDHDVDGVRGEAVPNLVQFAAAHERPRIGSWPPLHEGRPDPMARGGQQGRDLGHVRIEGDEEDVQRSGPGPGSTISVSTGNGGVGVSAGGFVDRPYGGGLRAPRSRRRGPLVGEDRLGEKSPSGGDGPEEDRPDDQLLGPPAIEDRHVGVRHEETEGEQGDRPEARGHVPQGRSEDSEGHDGGHRPEDERQEREEGVDQLVRIGRRDQSETERADPRQGDGDCEAATSDATKEERGCREERQSEERDRRVEGECHRAKAEVAEEVMRDVEAGVERLGNGQADRELAGPEGHQ